MHGAVNVSRRGVLGLAAGVLAAPALPAWAMLPADRDDLLGELTPYTTRADETLLDLARAKGLGVPHISAANPGIDPWVPGDGTQLTLPTAHILPDAPREGIVVNKSELRLYFFPKYGPPQTYAIGVGRDGFNTPVGNTTVVRKKERPTWYPTAETRRDKPEVGSVVPPGPDNPLGLYALYLGWPTYLIHGTHKPYGVGRRVSRGCIRMYPEGIEALFRQVPVGTKVAVVEQPVKVGWREGELYLQVLPGLEQIDELEATQRMSPIPAPDPRQRIVAKAGTEFPRIDWALVEAETYRRSGIPVRITRSDPQLVSESRPFAAPALGQPASVGHGIY